MLYPPEIADAYYEKRYWLGLTFGDILDQAADMYPRREALVTEGSRMTFSEFKARVDHVALALSTLGVKAGEKAILQLPNIREFFEVFFALHKLGIVVVLTLPRHTQHEITYLCKLTKAALWLVPSRAGKIDFKETIAAVQAANETLRHVVVVGDAVPPHATAYHALVDGIRPDAFPANFLAERRPNPSDLANILLTGGTTGLSKGVPRSHNDHICNGYFWMKAWDRNSYDNCLVATPVGHNLAHVCAIYPMILAGGKLTVITSTTAPDILSTIESERITCLTLVPSQVARILEEPKLSQYDLSSLKWLEVGGAHVPADMVYSVYEKIGCGFTNDFGMAEGPCTCTRREDPPEIVATTVGLPLCPYDSFKVIDGDGRELPVGEEGELVAKGPGVFSGYYEAEEDNQRVFTADGFFRTGDLAQIVNQAGYIRITGRKKDIIIRGGENISATEVEGLILRHPAVSQTAVVGMPDPILGERACAFVLPHQGMTITLPDLVEFLRSSGASVLLLPERLELIKEMPLTNVGKTDKKILRQEVVQRLDSGRRSE